MNRKLLKLFTVSLLMVTMVLTGIQGASACHKKNFPVKKHKQKKVVMVIAQQGFADPEFLIPKALFELNGAKVTVASATTKKATGMSGTVVKPDIKITDINVNQYDALVVVGGSGAIETLWDNSDLQHCVQKAFKKNKLVSAICAAPVVLARAGILDGKKATVFAWDVSINELEKHGATYVDEEVVVDGSIVTGRNPDASLAFGTTLCKELDLIQ